MSILTPKDLYNDRNNMRLREIFSEFNPEALLTMDRNGKEGKISLYKLYIDLSVDDPSEVAFAEEVFGDIYFWQTLCQSNWFSKHIMEWREIAAIKRKKAAFKTIVDEVKTKGKNSFSAAKYLIEEPWKLGSAKERKKVRQEIAKTAEEAFKDTTLQSDINRLKEEGLIQ